MENQYCTFFVGGLYMGISVLCVQEILRFQPMTTVPLACPVVTGLINLRGDIVTAVDLRRRLEMPDREEDSLPTNIIIRTESGPVSFLVDIIDDVVLVDSNDFEAVPPTLTGPAGELTQGVYKLEKRLLLVLDHQLAANVPDDWNANVSHAGAPGLPA